jgi:hypothetical protein
MVGILCTHVWKWNVETIPESWRGQKKGNDGEGEFNYDTL